MPIPLPALGVLRCSNHLMPLPNARRYLLIPLGLLALVWILLVVQLRPRDLQNLLLPSNPLTSLLPQMPASLKHLKVAPKEAHTATVIFLHVSTNTWNAKDYLD